MYLSRGRTAVLLGLGWTLICALLTPQMISQHFPLGDEWSLLAAADTAMNSPSAWFSSGFSDYFIYRPELMLPYTDFIRPVFNGFYWVLGQLLQPDDGGRLLLNGAALGLMSALAWWAITQQAGPSRTALVLAAALPLLPSLLPALVTLFPFLAYDPLTACFCLGAYIAYRQQRHTLAIVVLLFALLLKETALPLALALPVHHLLEHRADAQRARMLLRTAVLTLPLFAWILFRWLSFGDLTGGTYTVGRGPDEVLRGIFSNLQRWPLWVLRAPPGAGPLQLASVWLMSAANLALVAAGGWILLRRLLARRNLDAAEWTLIFSYGFMLLVGVYARYGAVLDAFLIVSLALWLREESAPAPRLAAAALAAGLLLYITPTAQMLRHLPPLLNDYQSVGRDYVGALRQLPPGRRVLVLNDPVSWHARLPTLAAVERLPLQIEKIADFTCPGAFGRIRQSCSVTLTPTGPLSFEFAQSCGLGVCGARRIPAGPLQMRIGDAQVQLPAARNPASGNPVWDSYAFSLDRGDLDLLYFDPSTRDFRVWNVP